MLHFAAILLHMSRPAELRALFTAPRQGILAATLLDPDRWWYLSDLARRLGVHHATLQRELSRLTKAEILVSRRDGNRVYYRANRDSPVFPDLAGLLTKTAGPGRILEELLLPFVGRIVTAFIYGSLSRGEAGAESDVDLMVIGEPGLARLAPRLRSAERALARPINVTAFTQEEFVSRIEAGSAFLDRVLSEPKQFIIGSEVELEDLARRGQHRAPEGRRGRDRGSASRG